MKRSTWPAQGIVLAAGLFSFAATAHAQDRYVGDYTLSGSITTRGGPSEQRRTDVRLAITKRDDGTYAVRRSVTYVGSSERETWSGFGKPANGRLSVLFRLGPSFSDVVTDGRDGTNASSLNAVYSVRPDGKVWGSIKSKNGWFFGKEEGARTSARAVLSRVQSPAPGSVFAVGQVVDVVTDPAGLPFTVGGAGRIADGKLQLSSQGECEIKVEGSDPVKVRAVALDVAEVTVLDAIELADAKPPHFQRALGADKPARSEPAAILTGQPLRLSVTLQAALDLSGPARLRLVAKDGATVLAKDVEVSGLAAGERVELASATPLTGRVAVNVLKLSFTVEAAGVSFPASSAPVALRVYTTHREPRKNIAEDRANPASKVHYEMACTWAMGASRNIGNGADSIGWNVDNQMRHYVHPVDYKQGAPLPAALPYGLESRPPLNYQDLPGAWVAKSNGTDRGVSSLYYPPLEVKKGYENWTFYSRNYGWWTLDNPNHTGGRCNQQASLVAGILGTLGIQAEVQLLERVGLAKNGRPARQYFFTGPPGPGTGPWNFHGLCKAKMDDGSEWLYDGSFSFPPNRKNGERSWAESAGPSAPFIYQWGPWFYEDGLGERVKEGEAPKTWNGIQ